MIHEELEQVTVQRFMDDSKRRWDEDIIQDMCNERDRKLIQQISIPIRNKIDSWYWILEDKGEFMVRSAYRHLQGESNCVDKVFWKKLWGMQLPGKVTNMLWRASREVLPTAVALRCNQVNLEAMCSWWQRHTETAVHVLFECSFAKEVWAKVGLQDSVDR